jgi:hypothetical protein
LQKLFAQKYTRKPNFGPIILLQRKKSFTKINQREQSKRNLESTIILTKLKMRRILPTKFQFGIMRRSNRMWTKWFKAKKISYGRENRSILLRHLEQLGANTFR